MARGLSDRTLHRRIGLDGPNDEVKDLADTIDDVLERLDNAFDAQRRFVANAAHELRTPLSIARTALDVHRAKPQPATDDAQTALDRVEVAVARSERLLESLLDLARAERRDAAVGIELSEVVDRILSEHHGVHIETRLDKAWITGDPVLIERLIGNLVDNAVHHGNGVDVSVQLTAAGDQVILAVANGGSQVDPGRVPQLFEPFTRLDVDRTSTVGGTGLGLSIVEAIARAHGGHVEALPRDGGGLHVAVTLPRTRSGIG
jgi:signal transduction histidine kinase